MSLRLEIVVDAQFFFFVYLQPLSALQSKKYQCMTGTQTLHLATVVAVLVVAIWGETFVSSKILLSEGMSPADIFFIRFCIAYLCMALLSHKRMWADNWRHEMKLFLLGVFGGSLYFLTENMALKYSTASNVAILVGTTPLVTALVTAACYREERMNRRQVIGSLIAFVGLVLVVLNGQLMLHLNPVGDVLALGASLTWAFYSLIMKSIAQHYDVRFITRKVFGYGVLSILVWFAFVEPLQTNTDVLLRPAVFGNLLYLALVASMLCFVAWNWVLQHLGIVRATNIIYSQAVFTMLFSSLILHEHITLMAISGTFILILGMVLMTKTSATL